MRPRVSGDVSRAQMFPPPADVHPRRITTECGDITFDPLQHRDLVEAAIVSRNPFGSLHIECDVRKETQCVEAKIVADEDNAFGHYLLAVVDDAAEAGRPLPGNS
jgi:hypothetical protein